MSHTDKDSLEEQLRQTKDRLEIAEERLRLIQTDCRDTEAKRDALAAKISKAIQYGNDTLNCNQTLKGQQFAANHFLKILRGEA